MASPKSWFAERLLWAAVCIVCITVAVIMMKIVWNRFNESPTVTNVETTNYPIWNIPFPAVTLCNNNKVYQPAAIKLAENLSTQLHLNYSVVLEVLRMLPALINPRKIDLQQAHMAQDMLFRAGYNITDLMLELAPPCEEILVKCIWQDAESNCSDLFQVSKSVLGVCCSFNYHGIDEKLRIAKDEEEARIHYAYGAGRHAGLTVVLNTGQLEYFAPLDPLYGIRAVFHDPDDFPDAGLQMALIEPQRLVSVMLEAQVVESMSDVRWISVQNRQCWFDDEVAVVHTSPKYSYYNCLTECRMKAFQDKCGCIPFFYPLFNDSSHVCTLQDTECLRQYRRMTTGLHPSGRPAFGEIFSKNETEGMNCTCLPQCTDMSYSIITEIAVLEPKFVKFESVLKQVSNSSIMSVFFRDITCMKYARDAYMTWDAVFATFGGIFGLCMGGSIISIFEIIYRIFLLVIATTKTLLRRCKQKPRENIVVPWNIKALPPHHAELLFPGIRHKNI
ncbi:sodium channel protein Nach isoform X3 [Cryptotermes secundus]|nr:sodium channel protein Nach isoform X3 [Cryptotermes secundus]XP_033606269.1 sodium channel protein Nach isoform X3 [Cryptotermes secundus]